MTMKITNEILEGYLNCKFKGHLKLASEVGTRSDYEAMTSATSAASREQTIAKLVARSGEEASCAGTTVTLAMLRSGPPLLVDVKLEDESLSLRFDALKRTPGPSRLGEHHFFPVLHHDGAKVGRQQKVLLAVLGLALARVKGCGLPPGWSPAARTPGSGRFGWTPSSTDRQSRSSGNWSDSGTEASRRDSC
jgi:hypothetical protein